MSQTPEFAARLWRPACMLLTWLSLVSGQAVLAQTSSVSTAPLQQELSLFEAVSSNEQAAGSVEQRGNAQSGIGPAFTLLGTSRIGSQYTAILAGRDGSVTRVSAAPGSTVAIPEYAGYQLVGIGSREVSLTTPGSDPCIEQQDKGVSCSAIGVTHLSLATAAPIIVPAPEGEPVANTDEAATEPSASPENPFAAALRMARERDGDGQRNLRRRANREALQLRRISAAEVPAGMRVVRTPLGDRLVPDSPRQ